MSGEVGESQQTVNLPPMAELVRIHPHPPIRLVMLVLHSTVANVDSGCGVRQAQDPLIREPGLGFEVPKLYCSTSVTSLCTVRLAA